MCKSGRGHRILLQDSYLPSTRFALSHRRHWLAASLLVLKPGTSNLSIPTLIWLDCPMFAYLSSDQLIIASKLIVFQHLSSFVGGNKPSCACTDMNDPDPFLLRVKLRIDRMFA